MPPTPASIKETVFTHNLINMNTFPSQSSPALNQALGALQQKTYQGLKADEAFAKFYPWQS